MNRSLYAYSSIPTPRPLDSACCWPMIFRQRHSPSYWISSPEFSDAIADFLRREQSVIENYESQLEVGVPYKKG
ncbi:MAG: hypothetical protein ABW166_06785 [Sedimenticola sp.]